MTPSGANLFTRVRRPYGSPRTDGRAALTGQASVWNPFSGAFHRPTVHRSASDYGLSLGSLPVMSYVASKLAPRYAAAKAARAMRFKLIVYSSTPDVAGLGRGDDPRVRL